MSHSCSSSAVSLGSLLALRSESCTHVATFSQAWQMCTAMMHCSLLNAAGLAAQFASVCSRLGTPAGPGHWCANLAVTHRAAQRVRAGQASAQVQLQPSGPRASGSCLSAVRPPDTKARTGCPCERTYKVSEAGRSVVPRLAAGKGAASQRACNIAGTSQQTAGLCQMWSGTRAIDICWHTSPPPVSCSLRNRTPQNSNG